MNEEKPKKEGSKFDRNDHTFRDKWIKRALKEIKLLEIKHVKTSKENETELVLLFRKKKIINNYAYRAPSVKYGFIKTALIVFWMTVIIAGTWVVITNPQAIINFGNWLHNLFV